MAVASWATGGGSGLGQSRAYASLPWANYRSVGDWVEEMVDAIGLPFDIWWERFIGGRFETDGISGRLKLLDLDYEPVEEPSESLATATEPATLAAVRDTVLDVLLYAAGIPWPVDGNWTTAQRREFVRVGWDALRFKGTRRRLLKLMAGAMSGVIYGASLPPFVASLIHGDGSPSPGYDAGAVPIRLLAGTVATTTANATVTGTGTAFVTDGSWNGLILLVGNQSYWISSVASATSLTLTTNGAVIASGLTARVVYAATRRPWLFEATRNVTKRVFPAWAEYGVGYSQFRAGFSATGEPVLAANARVGLIENSSFTAFTSSDPDNWTSDGTAATRATANASPQPEINHEFTSYCAQFDMTGASAGNTSYLYAEAPYINVEVPHRLEVDYAYTNDQLVDTMTLEVYETTSGEYWTGPIARDGTVSIVEGSKIVTGSGTDFDTTGRWEAMPLITSNNKTYIIDVVDSATQLRLREVALESESDVAFSVSSWEDGGGYPSTIPLPVGSSAVARLRYAMDVYPMRRHRGSSSVGTQSITVRVGLTCDGTDTTKLVHTLYRADLFEKHDPYTESTASGERTLWLPLRNGLGWAALSHSGGSVMIEPQNAQRNVVNYSSAALGQFEYHPALSGRAFRCCGAWTNLVYGSVDMSTDWASRSGAVTVTTGNIAAPWPSDAATSATQVDHVLVSNYFGQATATAPTSKSYIAGLWVKRLTTDPGNQAGTITITSGSTTVTGSGTSFSTASWEGAIIRTAAGYEYEVASVASTTSLTLAAVPTRTETAVAYAVSDITIQLVSTSTKTFGAFVSQDDGWVLLASPAMTFGGGDVANIDFRLRFPAKAAESWGVYGAYLYDVTSATDVRYPPIAVSPVGSSGTVGANYLDAVTDSVGSNVNSELMKTTLVSVSRGALSMTIVPTFGASSQPNAHILEICESSTNNVLRLHVNGGVLKATRINNAGTSDSLDATLTASDEPEADEVTWKRDVPIEILLRWDDDGRTFLSAGGCNLTDTLASAPFTDTSVDTLRIGANSLGANNFDGLIRDVEFIQVGTPVS